MGQHLGLTSRRGACRYLALLRRLPRRWAPRNPPKSYAHKNPSAALDLRAVLERVDPVGDELRVGLEPVVAREPERGCPRIPSVGECASAVLQRHVLADRVAFVAVDAALALLEIDGVVRQIPMDDDVAVRDEMAIDLR